MINHSWNTSNLNHVQKAHQQYRTFSINDLSYKFITYISKFIIIHFRYLANSRQISDKCDNEMPRVAIIRQTSNAKYKRPKAIQKYQSVVFDSRYRNRYMYPWLCCRAFDFRFLHWVFWTYFNPRSGLHHFQI